MQSDITVYGPHQNPILSAEVLTGTHPSDANWVADFRQQMFKRGFEPSSNYFLMVLPDKGFLWKDAKGPVKKPDYEFDVTLFLKPFVGKRELHTLSEQALTMAVYGWLDELMTMPDQAVENEAYKWLVQSGLFDLIKKNSALILVEART